VLHLQGGIGCAPGNTALAKRECRIILHLPVGSSML
jgi:hypothetical protein